MCLCVCLYLCGYICVRDWPCTCDVLVTIKVYLPVCVCVYMCVWVCIPYSGRRVSPVSLERLRESLHVRYPVSVREYGTHAHVARTRPGLHVVFHYQLDAHAHLPHRPKLEVRHLCRDHNETQTNAIQTALSLFITILYHHSEKGTPTQSFAY